MHLGKCSYYDVLISKIVLKFCRFANKNINIFQFEFAGGLLSDREPIHTKQEEHARRTAIQELKDIKCGKI